MAEELFQHVIHERLKRRWRVGEAEGHEEELEMPAVRPESRLGNVIRVHAQMVVPAAKVDLGEEAGTLELIQELIDHWNWKLVFNGDVVERP